MFTLNNEADYALLLISKLQNEDRFVPLSDLIDKVQLPQRFLARIASKLVKEGVLKSKEGKVGGYKLIVELNQFTLYDFLMIFDKNMSLVKCDKARYKCAFEKFCKHKSVLRKSVTSILKNAFTSLTLAEVVSNRDIG